MKGNACYNHTSYYETKVEVFHYSEFLFSIPVKNRAANNTK